MTVYPAVSADRLPHVRAHVKFRDHFLIEDRNVPRVPASYYSVINDNFLIDPIRACVPQVGSQ